MTSKDEKREWELPHLREAHKFPAMNGADFWDVKFYPYSEPGLDPVFAVVGEKRILVCRPPAKKEHTSRVEIIQLIIDEEVSLISELNENDTITESRAECHFSCTWSKDLVTGDPLLVVAGVSGKIKVFNALTAEVLRVLTGHGGEINDIVTSPINPSIIASASDDCTVRIWSLDPAHESQPCAAILEGEGHTDTVLSCAFHKNGRYILSGGVDHVINLWTLPVFPDINTGTKRPTRIFYPHFSTSEIHSDIVDCVAWHGDLILSKAANEDCIVLWTINNFDSSLEPLSPDAAPTTHDLTRDTRSAFNPPSSTFSSVSTSLFTRLLQFSIPDSSLIFMRFSLFDGLPTPITNLDCHSPSRSKTINASHAILAFSNNASKVFFWDLSRFENYQETMAPYTTSSDADLATVPAKHPFLNPFQSRKRGGGALGRLSKSQRTNSPTDSTTSSQVTVSDDISSSCKDKDDSQEGPNQTRGRSRKSTTHTAASSSFTSSDKEKEKDKDKERSRSEEKDWGRTRKVWFDKYNIGDPLRGIQAHGTDVVKGLTTAGRQVAWSSDGRWCVVVGSGSVISIFQRWRD